MKRRRGLRWWIVALVSCGTILNYLARNSLAALAPQLQGVLDITVGQYSYIVGAFQLAYTVMQPVCGFVVDRIGLRLGLPLFAAAWSITNMAHALAGGWMMLAGFRGLLGMSEAAVIPAGMKAIAEWFPARERSVATGWFNAGTSLGAMLAPPIVIGVSLVSSWRFAFVVTGALGLIWAAAWYLVYRPPEQHPAITEEEQAYITAGRAAIPAARASARDILTRSRFWSIAIARFLIEPAWQTFSFWIPLYLHGRGMNLAQIAMFAWLPFLAADLGGVLGGYLSPWLVRKFGLHLVHSRIAGVSLGAVLMIAPGCIGLAGTPYVAIVLFCIGGFAHQMISVSLNTLNTDVFAPAEVGTAVGFVGQAGWLGGLLFSLTLGQVIDAIGYTPIFASLTFFDLTAAVVLIATVGRQRQSELANVS
jgi:MFS transporter, ACS family, aldohexuronate transporter